MLGNFSAGCLPYFAMLANVFERRVKRTDPVRDADEIEMQRNGEKSYS